MQNETSTRSGEDDVRSSPPGIRHRPSDKLFGESYLPSLDEASSFIDPIMMLNESRKLSHVIDRTNIKRPVVVSTPQPSTSAPTSQRKQIQFDLNTMAAARRKSELLAQKNAVPKPGDAANRRKSTIPSSSTVTEMLNQLKMNEMRRKRTSNPDKLDHSAKHSQLDRNRLEQAFTFISSKTGKGLKRVSDWMDRIGNFVERPYEHRGGLFYSVFKFTLIFFSIVIGSLTTLPANKKIFWFMIVNHEFFYFYELFVTVFLSIEYILFIWSIGYRLEYNGFFGRFRFIRRSILLSLEALLIPVNATIFIVSTVSDGVYLLNIVSALRFLQIFRFMFIDRYAQSWKLLMKVVYKHRFELITSVYIGTIILLFSSYLILIFEKPHSDDIADDGHFHTYADALYWSIITMTTIGYGDRSPRTFYGKIIATTLCIVGVAFWTLPGGIIGSGFAFKIEETNKKNQLKRLLPAAATLIQSWWRVKATMNINPSSQSVLLATVATFDISKPLFSSSLRRLKKHLDASQGEDTHLLAGLDARPKPSSNESSRANTPPPPTIKHRKSLSESHLEAIHREEMEINELKDEAEQQMPLLDSMGQHETSVLNPIQESVISEPPTMPVISSHSSNTTSNQSHSALLLQLSPEHLMLIRTLLLIKFFAAKNKFKLAFKPYDFKDVIEQYKQGNADILVKIKDLHRRIEQMTYAFQSQSASSSSPSYLVPNLNYIPPPRGSSVHPASYSPKLGQSRRSTLLSRSFRSDTYDSFSLLQPRPGSPKPRGGSISPISPPSPMTAPRRPPSLAINSFVGQTIPHSASFTNGVIYQPMDLDAQYLSQPPLHTQLSSNSNEVMNERLVRLEDELVHFSSKLDRILTFMHSNQNTRQESEQ